MKTMVAGEAAQLWCLGQKFILYTVRPRPMWQEMSLKTPDPLSAFRGGSGNETSPCPAWPALLFCPAN